MTKKYAGKKQNLQKKMNKSSPYMIVLKQLYNINTHSADNIKIINGLFARAMVFIKADNRNINTTFESYTLLELATEFDKHEIIQHLLINHLAILLTKPEALGCAIQYAIQNGHHQSLELLVTKDILEKLRYHSKKESQETFYTIKNDLATLYTTSTKVKQIANKALTTIAEIEAKKEKVEKKGRPVAATSTSTANFKDPKASTSSSTRQNPQLTSNSLSAVVTSSNSAIGGGKQNIKRREQKFVLNSFCTDKIPRKGVESNSQPAHDKQESAELTKKINRKTFIIALGTGATVATAIGVSSLFTTTLLASRNQTVTNSRLVVNHFFPLLNIINKLLMKISPNLDLNNLAKPLTDPKKVVLIFCILNVIAGVIAGIGAVSSALAAGAIAYKLQGGFDR